MTFIATACAVAIAAAAPAPAPLDLPFARYRLQNGMEVIVHEDHRVPVVAVDVWVHVGSGNEKLGMSGFAHLFEHMMFQGAKHIGEDVHFDILKKAGASTINGTTNSDRTNYYEVVPSNQLETALWLESDRLGFLLDTLNDKSLANQRDVVRNERRQRYDNVPYGRARFAAAEALYPAWHPYRYLTIGKHEDVEAASVDAVKGFFREWYVPVNTTIAIVGDVDGKNLQPLLEKWFGQLPSPQTAPRRIPVLLPPLQRTVRKSVEDPFAKLTRIQYTWHSAPQLSDDDLDLSIAADVLGASGWGRLYKALVVDAAIAQDVRVSQDGRGMSGEFTIAVTVKPGVDVADVEKRLRGELASFLFAGPTPVELSRSLVSTEKGLLFGLDDLLNKAEMLQTFNHYQGDPQRLMDHLPRLRARTPQNVQSAAVRTLAKPRVEILTVPAALPAGGAP